MTRSEPSAAKAVPAKYRFHAFCSNIFDEPAPAALCARSPAHLVCTCLCTDDFQLDAPQHLLAFFKCKPHLFRAEIGN